MNEKEASAATEAVAWHVKLVHFVIVVNVLFVVVVETSSTLV